LSAALSLPRQAEASAGTEGASFLDIPVGAGPAALGSAYSALATDAYAPTWNPAGLGFLQSTQVAGQHLSYLESTSDEYVSIVYPVHSGLGIGSAVQYFGSGDIPRTDGSGNSLGNYSDAFAAYSLALGKTVTPKLSLGATGKWIHEKIADFSADAYAGDLGAQYQASDKLSLAAVLSNLGTTLKFQSDGDSLPTAFKLGGAYQLNRRWLLAMEGFYPKTGLAGLHSGVEWSPLDFLQIRAGYRTETTKQLSAMAGLSAGLGINLWGQELAYAWLPYGDLGDTQYFSLVLRFGEAERARRNLINFHHVVNRPGAPGAHEESPEDKQLIEMFEEQEQKAAQTPAGQTESHP